MYVNAGNSVIGPGSPSPGWITRVGFQNHHSIGIVLVSAGAEHAELAEVAEQR